MTDTTQIAVIGGSGLYQMQGLSDVEERHVSTPFGAPSDALITGTLSDVRVAFLPRHGRGHRLTPGEVPYRANIYALKSLGVKHVISVSACGSLREHLHPGQVVIPNQLVDFTKKRKMTFFGRGLVAHIGIADPFCPQLSALLADATTAAGGVVHRGGRFITIEGPRFSTKGESHLYRTWGLDIIGMTTSPEAFLAREAEMCYATMAHVTDYDVWHEEEEPVSVEALIATLNQNTALAQRVIASVVASLRQAQDSALAKVEPTCECQDALGAALITQRDLIPAEEIEKLGPIVSRYL
ncbi:MAG: S-methyl-5'-thioadenosine phosphorylase, partial [Anaerolineae bacterium]